MPEATSVPADVRRIRDLEIVLVRSTEDLAIWNTLMDREHPQRAKTHSGAQLRYLRAAGFSAVALYLKPRDTWLTWSHEQRCSQLHPIVNLSHSCGHSMRERGNPRPGARAAAFDSRLRAAPPLFAVRCGDVRGVRARRDVFQGGGLPIFRSDKGAGLACYQCSGPARRRRCEPAFPQEGIRICTAV